MKKAWLAATILLALIPAQGARADHSDGVYEIPSDAEYPSMEFDVVVVPPEHGQLYNSDRGVLNGSDPNEIGPNNSYLRATLAAIAEWNNGVDVFGSEDLRAAFVTNVYVVGRDTIPLEVALDPEIVVFTDESEGPLLGTAYHLHPITVAGANPGTCLVRSSRMWIVSFTYADMFNVMGQEFGHCLGLGHVGSQGGVDPTSEQKHPEHDVMNGFYPHSTGSKGTHLHCVSNLDVAGLEWNLDHPDGKAGVSYMPVADYRATCDGSAPQTASPTPGPSGSPSPSPSPMPSPSSPSPTPSPSPSPSPSPVAAEPEMHARSISLTLRGHLRASGRVIATDGFRECEAGSEVRILHRRQRRWQRVATTVATEDGTFLVRIPDRKGRYLARVRAASLDGDRHRCSADGAPAQHRH